MIQRLQRLWTRINWQYLIVGMALLLLSGCGDHPEKPPEDDVACWPCAVYVATFTALEKAVRVLIVGGDSGMGTCQIALMFLGIGLLFWIMFHVTKTILLPMQEPNLRKFIFPLTTVLFKAILVSSLIINGKGYIEFMGETFIQPVLGFFADVSKMILDSDDIVKSMATGVDTSGMWDPERGKKVLADGSKYLDSGLFGIEVEDKYVYIISRLYMGLDAGMSLGFAIWREAGFVAFIFGIFVICTFWTLMTTLPMSFLDAFVRIGAMLVLSPFCLVGWVFPPTKDWLGKLWGILLGAGMTVMFTCVYLALTIYVIKLSVERHYPGLFVRAAVETNPVMSQDVQTMSVSVIGIFVLTLSMAKFGAHIPKIANSFGAQTVNSSWVKVFNGLKQLSIAAGKAALAIALASPGLAKGAVKDVADVAKSAAGEAR